MSPQRQVYLLDPQKISPETIAVAFAKTSRSPETFREIADELTDEKSARFHEKWVVGYGHASVAEHAVVHIAVENISRLAVETLESNRLASYTEKSSRYQKWESDQFFVPIEFQESSDLDLYKKTCKVLFESYQKSLNVVRRVMESKNPRSALESEEAWERRIRTKYIDVCRFFLPACSLANVGVTINARELEHALCKMLSHPLEEVRATGEEISNSVLNILPTLVKYAAPSQYLIDAEQDLNKQGRIPQEGEGLDAIQPCCRLIKFDSSAELTVLISSVYRYNNISWASAAEHVLNLTHGQRASLYKSLFDKMSDFDLPIRETEHASFTFEIVLDQGAFFELKRHRMMSLSSQNLSTHLRYAVPKAITEADLESEFRASMELARNTYEHLCLLNPQAAAYIVPNAFNRRVLITLDFRSAFHLIRLRSAPNAHFSMRRIARQMAEQICSVAPVLGSFLKLQGDETSTGIEETYFTSMA